LWCKGWSKVVDTGRGRKRSEDGRVEGAGREVEAIAGASKQLLWLWFA
jgi:hypothetical protein